MLRLSYDPLPVLPVGAPLEDQHSIILGSEGDELAFNVYIGNGSDFSENSDVYEAIVALIHYTLPASQKSFIRSMLQQQDTMIVTLFRPLCCEPPEPRTPADKYEEYRHLTDEFADHMSDAGVIFDSGSDDDSSDEDESSEPVDDDQCNFDHETSSTPKAAIAACMVVRHLGRTKMMRKVMQDLIFINCRPLYQNYGIGSILIREFKAGRLFSQAAELLVTHADANAIKFFEKQGFLRDSLLTRGFESISEQWANAVPMCYMTERTRAPHSPIAALQRVADMQSAAAAAQTELVTTMARELEVLRSENLRLSIENKHLLSALRVAIPSFQSLDIPKPLSISMAQAGAIPVPYGTHEYQSVVNNSICSLIRVTCNPVEKVLSFIVDHPPTLVSLAIGGRVSATVRAFSTPDFNLACEQVRRAPDSQAILAVGDLCPSTNKRNVLYLIFIPAY